MSIFAAFLAAVALWLMFSDYWKETNRLLHNRNVYFKRIADALDKENKDD